MRIARFPGLLSILLIVAIATPAAAMWDGVRWNMSEAQVRAVLKAQVHPADGWSGRRVKPARQPALMLKDRLEGERGLAGQRVLATFWFNPDGRLWSVTESPLETDSPSEQSCGALEAALVALHGQPDLVTEKGDERYLNWRDEPKRTRIHLRVDGGDCTIEYRELRGPLDR